MKKVINSKKVLKKLNDLGVKTVGTANDFSSRYTSSGIWIDAEGSSRNCFNINKWFDTYGVNPELNELISRLGYWSEWQDAGTIILWKTETNDSI
jgi:hypothetical protein